MPSKYLGNIETNESSGTLRIEPGGRWVISVIATSELFFAAPYIKPICILICGKTIKWAIMTCFIWEKYCHLTLS